MKLNQCIFNRLFSCIVIVFFTLAGCDRSSSPEGRMSMKIEALQQQLIDSLNKQNQAILDSLSRIRLEIEQLKQAKN